MIVSLFVQIVIYQDESSSSSLVAYHLLIPVAMLAVLRRTIIAKPGLLTAFFIPATIGCVAGYLIFGPSIRGVQYAYALISCFVGFQAARNFNGQQRKHVYMYAFLGCCLFILYRNALFFDQIGMVYSRSGRNDALFFLAPGGRNIEATLLALLSILLINSRYFLAALLLALATSTLMMSRAGLACTIISAFLWMFYHRNSNIVVYIMVGCLIMAATVALFFPEVIANLGITRRLSISEDIAYAHEGQGRIALWGASFAALNQHLWGYGVGNGVPFSELYSNLSFRENNVHNIFLQIALECGILAAVLLAALVVKSLWLAYRSRSVESLFVAAAFSLGLVQFTGYEPYIWFFVGIIFGDRAAHSAGRAAPRHTFTKKELAR